ncbi:MULTISPECIES: hypothetical protein [Clostridium]|uniref:hypothetical protein n=1 Tax=Clostridium TaxID=1485 RepID=UPI000773E783|nr:MULTISPECIES: hypothetical protein [Clostridium]AUM95030.1 hypothetical protein RSJ11_07685 [Clostridium sporogenes]AVQ52468.1 hypothetical protein C7M59_06225 [Clostridium botulinum]MCW6111086.1 hypothetical protein [Clostridium sporogenes]
MYIKYDEFELLELFNSEPISIGNIEAGELIYSNKDDKGFSITLFISVYEQLAELTISYKKNVIFDCKLKNVISISKIDKNMIINCEDAKKIMIKFYPQMGVELIE